MFSLPSGFTTSTLSFAREFFEDISPLLFILFGIGIAFIILEYLLAIVEDRLEYRRALREYEKSLEIEAIRPTMREFHRAEVERKREEIIKEV